MELLALKCPNCSGSIELYRDRKFGVCEYCGQKLMIANDEAKNVAKEDIAQYDKLFDDGIYCLQTDDYDGLRKISDELLSIDDCNPHGWFFKGCIDMTELAKSDDECSAVLRKVKAPWIRSINYLASQYYVDEYSKAIGICIAHYSIQGHSGIEGNDFFAIVSELCDKIDEKFKTDYISEICDIIIDSAFGYLTSNDDAEDCFEYMDVFVLNSIAYDSDYVSIMRKLDKVGNYQETFDEEFDSVDVLAELQDSFIKKTKNVSKEQRMKLSSEWTSKLLEEKLADYWHKMMDCDYDEGVVFSMIRRVIKTEKPSDAYVSKYLEGPYGHL